MIEHQARVRQRAKGRSTPDMVGLNRKDKDLGRGSSQLRDVNSEIFSAPHRPLLLEKTAALFYLLAAFPGWTDSSIRRRQYS